MSAAFRSRRARAEGAGTCVPAEEPLFRPGAKRQRTLHPRQAVPRDEEYGPRSSFDARADTGHMSDAMSPRKPPRAFKQNSALKPPLNSPLQPPIWLSALAFRVQVRRELAALKPTLKPPHSTRLVVFPAQSKGGHNHINPCIRSHRGLNILWSSLLKVYDDARP